MTKKKKKSTFPPFFGVVFFFFLILFVEQRGSFSTMAGKWSKTSLLLLFIFISGLGTAVFVGVAFKDEERSTADVFMNSLYAFLFTGSFVQDHPRFDDGTHAQKMIELRERLDGISGGMEKMLDASLYTDLDIPMRDGYESKARMYHPLGYPSDSSEDVHKTWPVLLWIHGGGFCIGNRFQNDLYLTELAKEAKVLIFSIEYRLAPEHPFPQSPNDVLDHYLWLHKNVEKLHGDVHRIGAGGESAGGNLVAVLTQDLRDLAQKGEDVGSLKAQIITAPVTDGDINTDSYKKYGYKYGLTRQAMFGFLACYGGVDFAQIKDPRMFPLYGNLESLPPAVVIVFNHDPLCDDGIAYAKALEKEGIPMELLVLEGTHVSATAFPYFFHQEQYQTTLSATKEAIQRM